MKKIFLTSLLIGNSLLATAMEAEKQDNPDSQKNKFALVLYKQPETKLHKQPELEIVIPLKFAYEMYYKLQNLPMPVQIQQQLIIQQNPNQQLDEEIAEQQDKNNQQQK